MNCDDLSILPKAVGFFVVNPPLCGCYMATGEFDVVSSLVPGYSAGVNV
jgi:hypothetical protein